MDQNLRRNLHPSLNTLQAETGNGRVFHPYKESKMVNEVYTNPKHKPVDMSGRAIHTITALIIYFAFFGISWCSIMYTFYLRVL